MFKKILTASLSCLFALMATAQTDSVAPEPAPALSITGSVDGYYKYDFGKTKANNLTSFTNSHNSFELGMATVKFEHKTSKFDVVADLGFGKRAKEFSYNDEGITAGIKQLYISYIPATWLKLTAGSWATHVGYELVDAPLNRNYSMSYMFTNGPFFHTGLRADITAGKLGIMVGIANPTDFKYVPDDQINKKFFLGQLSYAAGDIFKVYLNFVGGKGTDTAKSSQFDLVITSKLSDKFSIGYNGTIASVKLWEGTGRGNGRYASSENWGGSALYLNLDPTSHFGLTLRGEYFTDKNQLKVYSSQPKGGTVFATTLSANIKLHSFVFIPEFRLDNASEKIFTNADGDATKSTANFLLAAVYSF